MAVTAKRREPGAVTDGLFPPLRVAEPVAAPRGKPVLRRTDAALVVVTLLLVAFGLIMMYSASYASAHYMFGDSLRYISGQLRYAAIGIAVMLVVSRINYRILHSFARLGVVISVVLLAITLAMPEINHAKRWILIGPSERPLFTMQPSEIAKFAMILFVSDVASRSPERMRTIKYGFLVPLGVLAAVVGIMMLQPHLSGSIIIAALTASLMLIGGTRWQWFGLSAAIGVPLAAAYVFAAQKFEYAAARINVWLDPWSHLKDGGYQTVQSLLAIGSGGLLGLGLGNSRQKHLYMPESHNDFIFAIICEELGLVGAFFVLALLAFFIVRGFSVAMRSKDRFGAMLAMGITLQVGLQSVLNVAVVTNSIPNTGISLPFFSQGGTSLMILLAEVGVMMSVSRFGEGQTAGELMRARRRARGKT